MEAPTESKAFTWEDRKLKSCKKEEFKEEVGQEVWLEKATGKAWPTNCTLSSGPRSPVASPCTAARGRDWKLGELNNWGIDLWGWLAPTQNPNLFFVLEIGLPCIPLGLFRKKEKRERRGKKEEETKKGESGSKRVWSMASTRLSWSRDPLWIFVFWIFVRSICSSQWLSKPEPMI